MPEPPNASPAPTRGTVTLLVSTRKGAFFVKSDRARERWSLRGPHFLGSTVHHAVLDPRDRRTLLAAVKSGHLGPTVFRSLDGGKSWTEARRPPKFPRSRRGQRKRSVDHTFWLQPGHATEEGVWYAGTSPQGLFRSSDGGDTWRGVTGFNDHPMYAAWTGGEQDGTPDGPKLHSIQVDPRDRAHLFLGCSSGGVFESTDRGATWAPLNRGSRAAVSPEPEPEFGQDPHQLALHPLAPDVLYQQNHCGIYRMDRRGRASDRWRRIGRKLPKEVGDIGFPIALHPRDPDTVWVYPMDGTQVWPRTSPGGRAAVWMTRDGGRTWRRRARGLPARQAWFSVKRQCMAVDAHDPVGVYFGTSSGAVWASADEGSSWRQIVAHLPHVYAVEVAGRAQ